jgi:hypothetical protein
MKKEEKIREEIEKTLAFLDKKESLPPNPFFYTRIRQRLDEKSRRKFTFSGTLKYSLLILLLILNLTTVIWHLDLNETAVSTNDKVDLTDFLKTDFNLDNDLSEIFIFE